MSQTTLHPMLNIAIKAARAAGVRTLVHISAIGADPNFALAHAAPEYTTTPSAARTTTIDVAAAWSSFVK